MASQPLRDSGKSKTSPLPKRHPCISLKLYRSSFIFLQAATMPVSRLSSQHPSRPPANQPYPLRAPGSRSKLNPSAAAEVIILSSGDEEELSKNKVGSSTRSKRKPSRKPISAGEVLEIFSSSSDEEPPLPKEPAKCSEGSASHRDLSRLKCVCLCYYHSISLLKDEVI